MAKDLSMTALRQATLDEDPELTPALDRGAKEAGMMRWLHNEAKKQRVSHNDPAYNFMVEKLRENRLELEKVWQEGTDQEFIDALRRHVAIGRKALTLGVKAEDEVSRQKDEIVSAGQVFRVLEEQKA